MSVPGHPPGNEAGGTLSRGGRPEVPNCQEVRSTMKRFNLVLLAVAAAVALSAPAGAADFVLETSHSEVLFKVRHMGVSNVTGSFAKFEGAYSFDPATKTATKLTASIDAASVSTRNEGRDKHLNSADFFDTANHPKITFVGKEFSPLKGDAFTVKGDLTIRGVTKPVVLDVTYNGSVKDPWGNERTAFTATTKINRKDFGVNWSKPLDNGGLVVSDEVSITIEAEGVPPKPAAK